MSLLSDKELPEPITGIVNNVLLPAVSTIDPLFKLIGFELRYSKSRELKRVASIPTLALQVWANEYNGTKNWFALPKEVQKQIMKKKLNSNEFQYFKTAAGRL